MIYSIKESIQGLTFKIDAQAIDPRLDICDQLSDSWYKKNN